MSMLSEPNGTHPLLLYQDAYGTERAFPLDAGRETLTIGRRPEADLCLPWDHEISRLHAEIVQRAGEWIVQDEGLSQNGTYVNGLRVDGRRRLRDGDAITVGRTTLTFRDPREPSAEITMASPDLRPVLVFSEQQQRILRALCRPLLGDGEGVAPASDDEVAQGVGLPHAVVERELDHLARSFGYDDLALGERRTRTALSALRSGLARADESGL